MELKWRLHGGYVDVTWMLRGCYMEVKWRLHGGYVDVKWALLLDKWRLRGG